MSVFVYAGVGKGPAVRKKATTAPKKTVKVPSQLGTHI